MEFTKEQKEKIEGDIVETMSNALDAKTIQEEELTIIATYVLQKIDAIKNEEELAAFLKELSEKWPIFNQLYQVHSAVAHKEEEQQAVKNIENLMESGNIDGALAAAKSATHQA